MNLIGKYPNINPKAVFKKIDNQIVVILLDDRLNKEEKFNLFNTTGTRIWELCNGKRTVQRIVKIMHEEFNVTYQEAECETLKFIQELSRKNLITFIDNSQK